MPVPAKLASIFAAALLVACTPQPPAAPMALQPPEVRESRVVAGGPLTEQAGLALFDDLVAKTRRFHLFAPKSQENLGTSWNEWLPRLREEFRLARDSAAMTLAAWHFGNSLHDVHCQFRPSERGERIKLGFRVGVEIHGRALTFFVERVSQGLRGTIAAGDRVVSVDGVPAAELMDQHAFVSNANHLANVALDVAGYLTSRRIAFTSARQGDSSTWVLEPREGGSPRTLTLTWRTATGADDGDFALDYGSGDCAGLDPKDYGPYTLTARGYRACVYTSEAPGYRDYPIVRQTSFRYDDLPHGPLADYETIRAALAKAVPKGVLLDVQENGGGINPNLFVEWWTSAPYEDTSTRMLLDDALLSGERGAPTVSSVNDAVRAWYRRELAERKPGQRISRARPFMCKPDSCDWDNRYVPTRRVTTAPVALLLGPGCGSSCDALALHFDRNEAGPIVGRPAMGGFTTHRARFDVSLAEDLHPLGTIDFAVAFDTLPGSDESIEGLQVHLDVPVPKTAANAERYDATLVDAAISALRGKRGAAAVDGLR